MAGIKIEIYKKGQSYFGKIVWLKEPKDAKGNAKLDYKNPNESLMNLAYDYGYFDHNHLLRDFKQFTGSLPTQFDLETALIY